MAHSMTPMPKMMTQGKRHNLRACEIKIGIEIIKSEFGVSASINSLSINHVKDRVAAGGCWS